MSLVVHKVESRTASATTLRTRVANPTPWRVKTCFGSNRMRHRGLQSNGGVDLDHERANRPITGSSTCRDQIPIDRAPEDPHPAGDFARHWRRARLGRFPDCEPRRFATVAAWGAKRRP